MAVCTAAEVKAIAPEFAAVDDATVDLYVGRAELELNPMFFGQRLGHAGALLTAHLLTVTPPAGATPKPGTLAPIASQTVGGVSVTYAVAAVSASEIRGSLGASRYGAEYARTVRNLGAGAWLL